MNKNQFLEQLEKLLADLPEEERIEAIAWYHDYFDDAERRMKLKLLRSCGLRRMWRGISRQI